jgi:chemotaxis protein methyltransferase CheR
MTIKVPDSALMQLSEFVASHLGLHFPRERWCDLQRAVGAAAQECGYRHDLNQYVRGLLSPALTQKLLGALANHLTVGETYFFREKRSLEILAERIVPELISARAGLSVPIRIWCAGCATGEEPYSVAIVLDKLRAGVKDQNVEIVATDLNTRSLQKASAGTYGGWSFRDTPRWLRHTYFEAHEDGRCTIVPAIKTMVRFAPLNLMDDAYPLFSNWPNGFDVVFCRNVLMYFTPEGMRKVIRQLYRFLAVDGWLIVSPTETSNELFSGFATVSFGDATFYRKSATRLPTKPSLNVFDQSGSVLQLPELAIPAPEPAQISYGEIRREAVDSEAGSESTAPPAISYRQALALYEQGRYEDMEQMIVTLPSENPDYPPAMLLLARAYANQRRLAAALDWCDKAIAAEKLAAPAHYLRATILQEQGRLPEALLALRQAVYAEPHFVVAHFTLGNLALKHGRSKESEKHFENALLLLAQCEPEDIVPESEGLSVGRLREMIGLRSATSRESRTEQTVGLCL